MAKITFGKAEPRSPYKEDGKDWEILKDGEFIGVISSELTRAYYGASWIVTEYHAEFDLTPSVQVTFDVAVKDFSSPRAALAAAKARVREAFAAQG